MFVDTQARPQGEHVDAVAPTKLKLSAAIRIGTRKTDQCANYFYKEGFFRDKTCVQGAALFALGRLYKFEQFKNHEVMHELWPSISHETFMEIAMRNNAGESRESIADWLEAQGL